jgi:hypothetical protein
MRNDRDISRIRHWNSWRLCKPTPLSIRAPILITTVVYQCVRAFVHESRVFVTMVLILIFAEVLGLYGCVSLHFPSHYVLLLIASSLD